ncbi:MAG: IS1 family transposase [Leptolyngbyaceae cyanobacterium]
MERQPLTLRARINRLGRKTVCFSKSVLIRDTVVGLFLNRYEFGRAI